MQDVVINLEVPEVSELADSTLDLRSRFGQRLSLFSSNEFRELVEVSGHSLSKSLESSLTLDAVLSPSFKGSAGRVHC